MNSLENMKNELFATIALPGNARAKRAMADLKNMRSIVRSHLSAHDTGKLAGIQDEIQQGIATLKETGKE